MIKTILKGLHLTLVSIRVQHSAILLLNVSFGKTVRISFVFTTQRDACIILIIFIILQANLLLFLFLSFCFSYLLYKILFQPVTNYRYLQRYGHPKTQLETSQPCTSYLPTKLVTENCCAIAVKKSEYLGLYQNIEGHAFIFKVHFVQVAHLWWRVIDPGSMVDDNSKGKES